MTFRYTGRWMHMKHRCDVWVCHCTNPALARGQALLRGESSLDVAHGAGAEPQSRAASVVGPLAMRTCTAMLAGVALTLPWQLAWSL